METGDTQVDHSLSVCQQLNKMTGWSTVIPNLADGETEEGHE